MAEHVLCTDPTHSRWNRELRPRLSIATGVKGRLPANLARTVKRLDIVTFGRDLGSVTLEFERAMDG
jgi:hypothetical protein